ncbi:MAG: hypothetical protein JWQ66_167 [Mucilaginibacter sp.]|nr:hypothetical protein [Mucilaginibacter sp.]
MLFLLNFDVLNMVKYIGSGYPGKRFGAPKTWLAYFAQLRKCNLRSLLRD